MDPIVLSNKFDEINKKFEKLEAENKILKNEINSLKKIYILTSVVSCMIKFANVNNHIIKKNVIRI